MKSLKFLKLPLIMGAFVLLSSTVISDKETQRINDSAKALTDISKMKEGIPHELMYKYEAVVIIPKLLNVGLGIGGKRGRGVAVVKLPDGKWSNPVFVTLTGGSVGFQAGIQSVDLVLVFKNKGALDKVENGDFTLGGDVSVAAGPVGRTSSAGTDHKFDAEIYSYSRSKGVFAGISITGSNLSIDKSSNTEFYGKNIGSRAIFETGDSGNKAVENLKTVLSSF